MKLSLKLPLALAAALLLVLAAALTGMYQLYRSLDTFSTTVQASHDNQTAVNEIAIAFKTQVQEWKDTLLRGKDSAQRDKYWGAFGKDEANVAERVQKLVAAMPDGESRSLVEKFGAAHITMGQNYRKGFDAFTAASFEPSAGDGAVKGMDRAPTTLLIEAAKNIGARSVAASAGAVAAGQRAITISVTLMLVTCAVALLVGVLFIRSATRPVGRAAEVVRLIAAGDLTAAIEARGNDEIADLLRELDSMRASLVRVVGSVRGNADSVATASSQIAQGNADLSQRTEEQASNLQQTAASMEQLTATVKQNAETARQAVQLATAASGVAGQGGEVVGRVVATMEDISASSKKIADIIGVIDGIAFQTNILALNAAVEAARAGEQGRGFAVVAGEVRSLAQRSAEAAKEIKNLIGASVEKVATGSSLVGDAGRTMGEIVSQVKRVTDLINEISAASVEQTTGIGQIGDAVTQLDQVTQQNAALVEESAAAADSLQQQASQLAQAISFFTLDENKQPVAAATPKAAAAKPAAPVKPAAKAKLARRPAASAGKATPAAAVTAEPAADDNWTSF